MKDNKLKCQIAAGILLIVVGISLLLNDYILERREKVFSDMNLALSEIEKQDEELVSQIEDTTEVEENGNDTETDNDYNDDINYDYEPYLGTLEITKIGFYKGFYDKNSSLNNVKFNLKFLDVSSYPSEDRGNVIIIGHSGNYSNSYFGNLYKLSIGDSASIYYNNRKYNYKIVNIYNEYKDGTVTIYRDERKSCLTLITCTKDDEEHQTIYIFELESVE